MATDAQKAAVLQDEGMVSGSLVSKKRRKVGVPSLTAPLVPPFLREEEKGGNKGQQKVAFPGNRKEKKKCADGMVANQRRAAGDVRKKHHSGDKGEVMILLPVCLQMYQEVRKRSLCWTRPHCCGDVHQQPER